MKVIAEGLILIIADRLSAPSFSLPRFAAQFEHRVVVPCKLHCDVSSMRVGRYCRSLPNISPTSWIPLELAGKLHDDHLLHLLEHMITVLDMGTL